MLYERRTACGWYSRLWSIVQSSNGRYKWYKNKHTLFQILIFWLYAVGITNVKCIRKNTDVEGISQVYYKVNNAKPGWYP